MSSEQFKGRQITLEQVAMLVECPTCGACDIGGDDVEACWDEQGRDHEPVHEARLERAAENLTRARESITEAGTRS